MSRHLVSLLTIATVGALLMGSGPVLARGGGHGGGGHGAGGHGGGGHGGGGHGAGFRGGFHDGFRGGFHNGFRGGFHDGSFRDGFGRGFFPGFYGYGLGYGRGFYGYGASGVYAPVASGYSGSVVSGYYGPPAAPSATGPTGFETDPADASARMRIEVPADAEVWIDGAKSVQTSRVRDFVSPPLDLGKSYSYEVRCRWTVDGRPIEQMRKVNIRANVWTAVDFTRSTAGPEMLQPPKSASAAGY
jgi:uncharacterized protein (TIGR03000 family)